MKLIHTVNMTFHMTIIANGIVITDNDCHCLILIVTPILIAILILIVILIVSWPYAQTYG